MNLKTKANRVGNTSLAALSVRIIDTVQKSGIEEAVQSKQFIQLNEVNNRYQAAIMPGDTVETSKQIKAVFEIRNQQFIDMYEYAKGLTKSPTPDVNAAAVKVFSLLNKYGRGISNVKLADLSVQFIRIIEAMKSAEIAPAVAKLSLTAKLAEFEEMQLSYEDQYLGRGNNSSARVAPSNLRKEMENAVKLYVDELKWLANSHDTEAWKTLYNNVEQRFNEVNPSIMRKKLKADSPTTETTQAKV